MRVLFVFNCGEFGLFVDCMALLLLRCVLWCWWFICLGWLLCCVLDWWRLQGLVCALVYYNCRFVLSVFGLVNGVCAGLLLFW